MISTERGDSRNANEPMAAAMANEIARLPITLTDAEREAIAWVCFGKDGKEYATLRGLLERTK